MVKVLVEDQNAHLEVKADQKDHIVIRRELVNRHIRNLTIREATANHVSKKKMVKVSVVDPNVLLVVKKDRKDLMATNLPVVADLHLRNLTNLEAIAILVLKDPQVVMKILHHEKKELKVTNPKELLVQQNQKKLALKKHLSKKILNQRMKKHPELLKMS